MTENLTAYVVLYDGHCKFCTAQSKNLAALARQGAVRLVDFQQPGVLAQFPGVSYEACMQAMHLITPGGRVYRGFEAAVQAVATRPVVGWLAHGYYLPGIRQVCDWVYTLVAAHRYRLMGKAVAAGECDGGTCSLHAPRPKRAAQP
jgi:predicted DCC family thiol-disulfide oxidoreductase YuxK